MPMLWLFTKILSRPPSFGMALIFSCFISKFLYHDLLFSHAYLGFDNAERAAEILSSTDLKIAGKKVYVFPAYSDLLQELPDLGEIKAKLPESDTEEVLVRFHRIFH
jgi:hypothetical protein